MNIKRSNFEKFLALLLVVSMLFTTFAIAPAVTSAYDTNEKDYSSVMLDNYPDLNEGETALLGSGTLKTGKVQYKAPDETDAETLITVDPDNKTLKCEVYTDTYGNVWVPSEVKVVYAGGEEVVTVDTTGLGSFSYEGNAYNIWANYSLNVIIDTDDQQALLDAAVNLRQGYDGMEAIVDNVETIRMLENNIDDLKHLADGYDTTYGQISFSNEEYVAAVTELANQKESTGHFTYINLVSNLGNASSKTQYLVEHGTELRAAAVEMTSFLDSIVKYQTTIEANNNFLGLLGISTSLANILFNELALTSSALKAVCGDSEWAINTNDTFVENANYAAVDAIADKMSSTPSSVTLTDTFHIADAQLTKNLNRYNVTVNVEAQVVNTTTNELVSLTPVSTIIALDSGASAATITEAVADSLIESDALNSWNAQNSLYQINDVNYVRTEDTAPDTLASDIVYTISYVPATVTISADSTMGLPSSVPFGTTITLPKLGEEERVYDYSVNGTSYDEGTSIRVTVPVTITRSIGAAWNYVTLNSIVASSIDDENSADILNQTALKSELVRLRKPSGNIVSVVYDSNTSSYVVTAQPYSSGLEGASWIPATVNAVDENGNIVATASLAISGTEYSGSFASVDFDHAEVDYALDVTGSIEQTKLLATLNVPDELVNDAVDQKANISELNSQYSSLDNLNGQAGMLRTAINGAVDDDGNYLLTPEIKEAGLDLVKKCFNSVSGNLYIYEYLTAYRQNGLVWLYHQTADGKYDNYETFKTQLDILKADLPNICDDAHVFKDYLDTFEYNGKTVGEYYDRLVELVETVEDLEIVAPNSSIDGTKSDELSELVDAIEAAVGYTHQYTTTDGVELVLHETVNATAPNKASVIINVTVNNAQGQPITSSSKSKSYASGTVLTDSDVSVIEAMLNEIIADVDTAHYELDASSDAMVEAGTTLDFNKTLNITYVPKTYTVSFNAVGFTASIPDATFKYGNNTVVIPAFNEDGYRYDFAIGSETVSTTSTAVDYVFTKTQIDNLFENGEYTITVTKADESQEKLIRFVDAINASLSGYTSTIDGKVCQNIVLIPVQDNTGKISFVFRISVSGEVETEDLLSELAEAIVNSEYDEIKMTDEVIFSNLTSKVSMPAILNVLLNSGLSFGQIANMIDENGDLVEMSLEGTCIKTVDVNNEFAINTNVAKDVTMYGAELFGTTLGLDADTYDCYFTLEDFDKSSSSLKNLKDAADKINEYLDVTLENGGINIDITLPDLAYNLYMLGLVATDKASIRDINNIDLSSALAYIYDIAIPTLRDAAVTFDTVDNTASEISSDIDVSGIESYFELLQNILREITENSTIAKDTNGDDIYGSVGSVLNASYQYDSDALIDTMSGDNSSSLSRFVEAGLINYDVELKLNNADNTYEALVVNAGASGVSNKIKTYKNGETGWTDGLYDQSIIVLLSNATEDIITDKKVYVDLNGFTLNGKIEGENIVLVDSTFNNTGAVTGNVDVKTDARTNDYYSLEQNGDTITVKLNAALFNTDNLDGLTDANAVAFDALFDIALNYFTAASLKINDNNFYDINVDDIVALYKTHTGNDVNDILDLIDCAGITTFASDFIDALTDFGAIATAIENDQPIYSAELEIGVWVAFTYHDTDNDTIAVGIKSSTEKKTQTIEFVADGSADDKSSAAELFSGISSVVTIDADVELEDVSYADKNVTAKINGSLDIVVDFTDPAYPIALAIVAGGVNGGTLQSDAVEAINYYYTTGLTTKLKDVVGSITTAELENVSNAFDSTTDFSQMITNLGLDSVVGSEVTDCVDNMRAALNFACAVIRHSDETGSDTNTVSNYETTYGVYEVMNTSDAFANSSTIYNGYGVGYDFEATSAKVTLNIFEENPSVVVVDGENVVYSGESIADAIDATNDGSEVIISNEITLDADLAVSHEITITGAEKIDFGTSVIYLDDNASITFETSIPAEATFEALNADTREIATDSNKVYTVEKECQHVWDAGVISVAPTCTLEGVTLYTCTLCDETKTEAIPANGHTFVDRYCSICDTGVVFDGTGYLGYENGEKIIDWYTFEWGVYYFSTSTRFPAYARRGESVVKGNNYTFTDDGLLIPETPGVKNGVVDGVYYVNDVATNAGVVEQNGNYYYSTTHGVIVTDRVVTIYSSRTNGLIIAGEYSADATGILTPYVKNGVVNGVYYVNNVATNAGVVEQDGNYYYSSTKGAIVKDTIIFIYSSRTNGLIATGEYVADENGVLTPYIKNGIVDGVYYIDNVASNVGLIYLDGLYYYSTTHGVIITNKTIYIKENRTNGLLPIGDYTFGPDGVLVD